MRGYACCALLIAALMVGCVTTGVKPVSIQHESAKTQTEAERICSVVDDSLIFQIADRYDLEFVEDGYDVNCNRIVFYHHRITNKCICIMFIPVENHYGRYKYVFGETMPCEAGLQLLYDAYNPEEYKEPQEKLNVHTH